MRENKEGDYIAGGRGEVGHVAFSDWLYGLSHGSTGISALSVKRWINSKGRLLLIEWERRGGNCGEKNG